RKFDFFVLQHIVNSMQSSPNFEALKTKSWNDLLGVWSLGITLLFPWVFVFALPPLQMGIWLNTNGVAFAIASLSVVASLVLLWIYGTQTNFKIKTNIFQNNPLLLGTIGLATLSILFLPFSYNHQLSWFGHPELMNGGWLWLSVTVIILCHLWLRQHDQNHL